MNGITKETKKKVNTHMNNKSSNNGRFSDPHSSVLLSMSQKKGTRYQTTHRPQNAIPNALITLRVEADNQKAQNAVLMEGLQQLKHSNQQMEQHIRQMKQQMEEQKAQSQEQIHQMEQHMEEQMEEQKAHYQKQIQQMEQQMEEQKAQSQEQIHQMEEQLRNTSQDEKEKYEELEEKFRAQVQQSKVQEQTISKNNDIIADLENQLAEQKADFERTIAQQNAEFEKAMTGQQHTHQLEIAQLDAQLQAAKQKTIEQKQQLDDFQEQLMALSHENGGLKTEVQNLSASMDALMDNPPQGIEINGQDGSDVDVDHGHSHGSK